MRRWPTRATAYRAATTSPNAIAFAARKGIATDRAELYTTVSPCLACAKLIINAGIE
ncbi:MAG: cytidine deaminase, partial [Casimicrobiaceae bacterium]